MRAGIRKGISKGWKTRCVISGFDYQDIDGRLYPNGNCLAKQTLSLSDDFAGEGGLSPKTGKRVLTANENLNDIRVRNCAINGKHDRGELWQILISIQQIAR